MTILMTAHYLEEAKATCTTRIALIDHGKLVALDTPETLELRLAEDMISLSLDKDEDLTSDGGVRYLGRAQGLPHMRS